MRSVQTVEATQKVFISRPLPSDVGQAPALEIGVLPSELDMDQNTSVDVQTTCATPEPHTVLDTDTCDQWMQHW